MTEAKVSPQRGSRGHLDLCCASLLPNGRVYERILCGADRGGRAAMAKRGQSLRKARAVRRPAMSAVDLKTENAALKRELAHEREQRAATEREALEQQTATAEVL